jgi:predicted metal-dependent hydrolase
MPGKLDEIRKFYEEAFGTYDKVRKTPQIDVEFYPYVGINHTIRVREGRVYVRVGEICRDMPLSAQRALAYVLVSKLYRRRAPKELRELYSDYIKTEHIRERATESKRTRGRKIVSGTEGEAYDLDKIFDRLNIKHFDGKLPKPVLTWSARKTYRVLGHHDATHDTVVISRSLDSRDTPRFVVEYVLFHEMLHIHHPTVHHNGRRYNHTAVFRRDEEKFEHYERAEEWIERNVRKLQRNARKKR